MLTHNDNADGPRREYGDHDPHSKAKPFSHEDSPVEEKDGDLDGCEADGEGKRGYPHALYAEHQHIPAYELDHLDRADLTSRNALAADIGSVEIVFIPPLPAATNVSIEMAQLKT